MRIDKIYVENFGTLHEYSLDLADGVNPVFEDNGFGKTTLAVFIKAMLYGMPASRVALADNERKKYTPWQGGAYGGSVEFSVGAKKYRIERFFGAKESEDTFELYDLATNTRSDDYSENIGEELFGVSAGGYERSTYFSSRVLKGKDDGSILDKLHSMLEDSGEDESFERAIGVLSEQKKKLRADRGEGGLISELEKSLADNQREEDELSRLEVSLQECQDRERELSSELCQLDAAIAQCDKELEAARSQRERAMAKRGLSELEAQQRSVMEKLKECDEFFGECDTTPAEISAYYELEKKFQIAKHDAGSARLSESESRELCELADAFADKNVDTETVNEWRGRVNAYEKERVLIESEMARLSETPRYADMFKRGVPSEQEIDGVRALAKSVSERKSAKENGASNASAKSILASLCIALGLMGVLTGVLSLLNVIPTALLSVSAACIAAGVACLMGALAKGKGSQLDDEQLTLDEQKIKDFLDIYGLSGNAYEALARLEVCIVTYAEDLDKKASDKKKFDVALASLDAQKEKILSFISALGGKIDADMSAQLDAIAERLTRYAALDKKAKALRAQRAKSLAEKEELEAKLDAYVGAYFGDESEFSYTESLRLIEDKLSQRRDASERLSDLLAQIEKYKAQNEKFLIFDGEESTADADALGARAEELRAKRIAVDARLVSERERIDRISDTPDKLLAAKAAGERLLEELSDAKARCEAIEKTIELMKKAKDNLSSRYIGKMQEAFCAYAKACGFDDKTEFVVDSELDVKIREHGKSRELDYYSRGMREMIELCARLSLIDVMFEDEKPFLVLDDPFANLDDDNVSLVAALMRSVAEKYQIIYTYCHSSRAI